MINIYLHSSVDQLHLPLGEHFQLVDEIDKAAIIISKEIIPIDDSGEKFYLFLQIDFEGSEHSNLFLIEDDDVENLLPLLASSIHDQQKLTRLNQLLKKERAWLRQATKYIERKEIPEDWFLDSFYRLLIFSNEVSRFENLKDVEEELNNIFRECKIKYELEIVNEFSGVQENNIVLMITKDLFLDAKVSGDLDAAAFLIYMAYEIIQAFYNKEYKLKSHLELWEAAFEKIKIPAALFSLSGELILHNSSFLKLGILPNECMKLEDGDKVEKGSTVYFIKRVEINSEKMHYFLFTNELESASVRNISAQELGIISSSVAHELNNPLAGIIAAVTLLQLDDISTEMNNDLEEMKLGAQRCKQLVEIFLGFSKKNIGGQTSCVFEDALTRAISLLRFRMIESNIRVDVTISEQRAPFQREINVSVVAMIFYLILSEAMTQMSHNELVASSGEKHKTLRGDLQPLPDRVELSIDHLQDYSLDKATLVINLIQIEGLTLEVDGNTIIIS